ncbi:MAG TPA: metallophosphoesterase family protein [Thermomicrobiales bacterium]|nr:metallophosphoesterase family protein [Thermomicrobiales bacterium]
MAVLRLALLSDVHGNRIALEAVLADITARGGADAYWVVGDIPAIGYDPVGVIERLVALPDARFVRGNSDRYTVTGELPRGAPSLDDIRDDPQRLRELVLIAESSGWTRGAVTLGGWFDWLAGLPAEQRWMLPDGTRLLAVHAAPGRNDGPGVHPELSDDELRALLGGGEADLVIVGHTHRPLDRVAGGVRVVNLGSLSNPPRGEDPRASYVLLVADKAGYRVEHRRVDYDRRAVIREVQRVRHPAAGYLIGLLAETGTRGDGR